MMEAAIIGALIAVFGTIIGVSSQALITYISDLRSREQWASEQKVEQYKWLRERLQEVYSNCIDCLTEPSIDCGRAQKWLNLLLVYYSSRDTKDYNYIYERVLALSTEDRSDWIARAKELTTIIIEMAANDQILKGDFATGKNSAVYWAKKGKDLLNQRYYDDALKCFDNALQISPQYANALLGKGLIFEAKNQHDEAIKYYDEALKIDPQLADAWYKKGIISYSQQKYKEAINYYDKAININPKFAEAWRDKSDALSHLGDEDGASKSYDKAIDLDKRMGYDG
jgi:tetratricopeptide (TPR) repeat protein